MVGDVYTMNSHGLSLALGLCMYGGLKATGRQRALKKSPSLPYEEGEGHSDRIM